MNLFNVIVATFICYKSLIGSCVFIPEVELLMLIDPSASLPWHRHEISRGLSLLIAASQDLQYNSPLLPLDVPNPALRPIRYISHIFHKDTPLVDTKDRGNVIPFCVTRPESFDSSTRRQLFLNRIRLIFLYNPVSRFLNCFKLL